MINFSDEVQTPALALNLAYAGPFEAVDALSGGKWPDIPLGKPYRIDLPPMSGIVLQLTPK